MEASYLSRFFPLELSAGKFCGFAEQKAGILSREDMCVYLPYHLSISKYCLFHTQVSYFKIHDIKYDQLESVEYIRDQLLRTFIIGCTSTEDVLKWLTNSIHCMLQIWCCSLNVIIACQRLIPKLQNCCTLSDTALLSARLLHM